MKPAARVLDVTSNMTGEKVGMTIDDSALAHIMSVLTDLYSDPELACLREYSTNALDAHVEARIKRPIEVNLPSPLSPFLSIRDFGEGLDISDIHEIYSRYGTSTKRNSNDVVGMLGLGCKSALTYTDQFTLTAVKNGKMIQVSISRDEDGSGSMMILDERETDRESGVEVMIPAKMGNRFMEKACNFFQYWEKGTVLVNGKEPVRIDGIWLSDNLLLTTKIEQSVVVMGNVPYPMLSEINSTYGSYNSVHTVAFVDIGEVHFTPSREALQATKVTKETLTGIKTRVMKEKDAKFVELIDESPDRYAAFKKYHEVKQLGYSGGAVYKGEEIPLNWVPPAHEEKNSYGNKINVYDYSFIFVNKTKSTYRRSKNWSTTQHLGNDPARPYAWVTGYESDAFTPYKREKMDQFFSHHNLPATVETIIFVPTLPDKVADWTPKNLIFKWEDIEKEKIVRENVKRNDGRPTGSYKGWVAGVTHDTIVAGDIDTSKPLFWLHTNNNLYYKPDSYREIIKKHPDATFIVLGGNRIEKFKRDFPTAENGDDFCRDLAKSWGTNLSDDDRLALYLRLHHSEVSNLSKIDVSLVSDPELVSAINAYNGSKKRGETLEDEYNRFAKYGASYEKVSWKNPLDKYVLLTSIYHYGSLTGVEKSHLYLYLNSVYASIEADKEGASNG